MPSEKTVPRENWGSSLSDKGFLAGILPIHGEEEGGEGEDRGCEWQVSTSLNIANLTPSASYHYRHSLYPAHSLLTTDSPTSPTIHLCKTCTHARTHTCTHTHTHHLPTHCRFSLPSLPTDLSSIHQLLQFKVDTRLAAHSMRGPGRANENPEEWLPVFAAPLCLQQPLGSHGSVYWV